MKYSALSKLLILVVALFFTGCATTPKEEPKEEVKVAAKPTPTPVIDEDNDGIIGIQDGCPNRAEDIDGYLDKDGCPELDNDYDGIMDTVDKCPNSPEDPDGFQDSDGCPDLDNDGDGIPDALDGDPNVAETFNQYQDEDGIPDSVPGAFVLEGVNFDSGSAKLQGKAFEKLEVVGGVLKEHKSLRVRVEGFTDDRGSEKANLALSERRAKSVKDHLVSKYSVSPGRLGTVGYGEARPVAENKTAEGRARNRRVEITPIIEDEMQKRTDNFAPGSSVRLAP